MKRWIRRVAIVIGSILVLIILSLPLLGWYLAPGYSTEVSELDHTDAIVVISGGGGERIDYSAQLFNQGISPLLIVSGAAREGDYSNAQAMKRIAMKEYHVPASAIITENKSVNTNQNAVEVAKIVQNKQLHSITLVTSAYHQRRAYRTFRHVLGVAIAIQNSPAHTDVWSPLWWWKEQRSRDLTYSETGKILWSIVTGKFE